MVGGAWWRFIFMFVLVLAANPVCRRGARRLRPRRSERRRDWGLRRRWRRIGWSWIWSVMAAGAGTMAVSANSPPGSGRCSSRCSRRARVARRRAPEHLFDNPRTGREARLVSTGRGTAARCSW